MKRQRAGLALVWSIGCVAHGPARGVRPADEAAITDVLPAQGRFAPDGPAATHYNAALEHRVPSAFEQVVLATLQRFSVAARPMLLDERLSRACTELAVVVPGDGGLSDVLVDFALQRHGIVEPAPKLFVVWGDPTAPELITRLLQPKLSEQVFYVPAVRVGIGIGPPRDGVAPIVVAVLGTSLTTEPIPREPSAGSRFTIDATVNERLRDPVVAVAREDGTIDRPKLEPIAGGRFTTTVACGEVPGRLQIDITATHPSGPSTLASFPVWCGVLPPSEYRWERAQIEDGVAQPELVERRLVALINRDRLAAGLPLLRSDGQLTAAARTHAGDQRRRRGADFAVNLPGVVGGSTAARVLGLRVAYEGFANTRGPHEYMLARTATHIGAGVVRGDDGGMFITLLYRRVPQDLDVEATARELTQQITAWIEEESYPELAKIARRMADELVAGVSQVEAWNDMRWWLDEIRYRFKRFTYTLTRVPDLGLVQRHWLLGPGPVHAFGVAVRQKDHPTYGRNAIWIIVVMGERLDR